jgi:hypothetical protein
MICVALLFLRETAFAQNAPPAQQANLPPIVARVMDFERRHEYTVEGKDNPAALDRGAVLSMFFGHQSGPADDAAFAQLALEHFGATGADTETLKEARALTHAPRPASVDTCARVLDGSLPDGMSIAKYITKVNQDSDRAIAAPYQAVIDKLSPAVRANVLRAIDEEMAGMGGGGLDHLGAAQDDPELYQMLMRGRCLGAKHAREIRQQQQPEGNPPRHGEISGQR